jgi:hypothetical protein
MNKLRLFDPNALSRTNFTTGCHRAAPKGRVVYPERDEVLLLHYKNLGVDYRLARNRLLFAELRPIDIEKGRGHDYVGSRGEVEAIFESLRADAFNVTDPGYHPWDEPLGRPRWWREPWPRARSSPAIESPAAT